jgi:molybdenum cofactor guanylyltransferase
MGQDKALLKIEGQTLLQITLTAFLQALPEVILIGDRPERFAGLGVSVHPDIYPGSALGGLYTGLVMAETSHIFVGSCDLSSPNVQLIRQLTALASGNDVVVVKSESGYEPLFAVYSQACLEPIRQQILSGNYCIYDFYHEVVTRIVSLEEIVHLGDPQQLFLNLNTPQEYQRIIQERRSCP